MTVIVTDKQTASKPNEKKQPAKKEAPAKGASAEAAKE